MPEAAVALLTSSHKERTIHTSTLAPHPLKSVKSFQKARLLSTQRPISHSAILCDRAMETSTKPGTPQMSSSSWSSSPFFQPLASLPSLSLWSFPASQAPLHRHRRSPTRQGQDEKDHHRAKSSSSHLLFSFQSLRNRLCQPLHMPLWHPLLGPL